MTESSEDILFDLTNKVLTITLNKPEKLNPIGDTMTPFAVERLRDAASNPEVGCVVLTGAGRAFCAGGDVSNMGGASDQPPRTYEENVCLLYTSPSPRDGLLSRMPSSA